MAAKSFVILSDEAPAQTKPGLVGQEISTGRYAFRAWPHDLPEATSLLQQSWPLVARLGDTAPAILPMAVRKSRLLFRQGSSRAEICRVTVAGWSRLTLAIEDPDPDGALVTRDALRLRHMPNRSYGDVLCRRRLAAASAPLTLHPVN